MLHKIVKRQNSKKKWLRNTPLKYRGWVRCLPMISFHAIAPVDFRFLENTKECSAFFDKMRKFDADADGKQIKSYRIDLRKVECIDFAATMLLTAIGEEMKNKGCSLAGNVPKRPTCSKYLRESGFFNQKFDQNGRQFSDCHDSEFITIERGQEKFSQEHQVTIRNLVRHVVRHLKMEMPQNRIHTSMIKEICANSVEWSEADKSQWTIGAKFEEDKVIFVALDLGKGIIRSLYVRAWQFIKDLLCSKSDADILYGAFIEKYGSQTQEPNRNRGLPSIKSAFDGGFIKELKVVANNAVLDFSDIKRNQQFSDVKTAFCGTLYSWRIDRDCIK